MQEDDDYVLRGKCCDDVVNLNIFVTPKAEKATSLSSKPAHCGRLQSERCAEARVSWWEF